MAQEILNNAEDGDVFRGKLNDNFTELYAGSSTQNENILEWAHGKDYQPMVITRDSEGRVTSMTVQWPDGSAGTYTATNYNATHEVYDGYTITHTASAQLVTQAAVTRDADGAITNKPLLTIA